jgi:hypothetical protein
MGADAPKGWSRRFIPPIKTPGGDTLRTLQDAAEYALALPEMVQAEPAWQRVATELKNAAELDPAWMWFARSAMMNALLGPEKPRIGNSESRKGHRWRNKRKLARDR